MKKQTSPRRWARGTGPGRSRTSNTAEFTQLRRDLPVVRQRMAEYGYPSDAGSFGVTRIALTRLQSELRHATEESPGVAGDSFLQETRKYLHLLLDH